MKLQKQIIVVCLLLITSISYAQKKKVAVVTFFADKVIDLSNIDASADLIVKNTSLSDNPNFNLDKPLQNFHKEFFTNYIKHFNFEVIDEKSVVDSEGYKTIQFKNRTGDNYNERNYNVIDGYQVIAPYYTKEVKSVVKDLAKELNVDAIMFVYLRFDFNKTGIGRLGYMSIRAKVNIDLYDKNGKSVFLFNELAGSKKKAVMVAGLPVMKPSKIQPMCESAIESLMKDLNKKLARLAKKTAKKLK